MRTSVAVLIPVLGRPQRVGPLIDSLTEAEDADAPATPYFVCSPGDDAEIAAVRESGGELLVVDWRLRRGDGARLAVALAAYVRSGSPSTSRHVAGNSKWLVDIF